MDLVELFLVFSKQTLHEPIALVRQIIFPYISFSTQACQGFISQTISNESNFLRNIQMSIQTEQ